MGSGDSSAAGNGARRRVGVFGGSFNPVHSGHIELARGVVSSGLVDEVWLVMSPLNPFKAGADDLAPDADRLAMLRLAVEDYPDLHVSDIELSMPRPSYTVNTLERLARENPATDFRLIIGADNWVAFDRWRDPETILRRFPPIVYPRSGSPLPPVAPPGVDFLDLPLWNVSSTEVREMIREGKNPNNLIPAKVYSYIVGHGLYR